MFFELLYPFDKHDVNINPNSIMIDFFREKGSFLPLFWRQIRVDLIHRSFIPTLQKGVIILFTSGFLSLGFISAAVAQTEDTTRVDRQVPERIDRQTPNIHTPINIDIMESSMSRYRVNDPDGNYTFHLRLRDESVEDFLFKEGSYNRYGPEWERRINEDLMRIVDEIFEETHPLLGIVNRIAPFLGIGFFTQQPGFRPPPRIEFEKKETID